DRRQRHGSARGHYRRRRRHCRRFRRTPRCAARRVRGWCPHTSALGTGGASRLMEFLRRLLDPPPPRPLLWFLVLINLVGAAFGYNWYAAQLSGLPAYTWIVVADSPLSVT